MARGASGKGQPHTLGGLLICIVLMVLEVILVFLGVVLAVLEVVLVYGALHTENQTSSIKPYESPSDRMLNLELQG